MKEQWLSILKNTEDFFNRSTRCLEEEHSTYTPVEGTFTTAQQIAHVAQTVDWFLEGATGKNGFNMDFESHIAEVSSVTSITEARKWLKRSFDTARAWINDNTDEQLAAPLPDGPVMPGLPKFTIIPGIEEHTAHHRGALTVYSRLLKLQPPMPYMEMQGA